jgi:hypothetical protein
MYTVDYSSYMTSANRTMHKKATRYKMHNSYEMALVNRNKMVAVSCEKIKQVGISSAVI